MLKQLKNKLFDLKNKKENVYILISVFLPLVFYISVFWGKSFGFDCAPGVMGNLPPYQQDLTHINQYCATITDPGAYIWQHPAQWLEVARQVANGSIPTWTQNEGIGLPLLSNFISNALYLPLIPFILLFYISGRNLMFIDLFFIFRYVVVSVGMYLFLKSFKVSKISCLIGSLAMFSIGYYIYIPNISHHNVDILLPFIAWSINKLYFEKKIKWLGISGLLLGLSMLGGMPESSIFILFFVGIYITLLSFIYLKEHQLKYFLYGTLILLLGLAIGAIVYLPGLELIANGVSSHHAGTNQKFVDWRNIILFVMPEIFAGNYGYQFANQLNFAMSSWNYVGVSISYLYLVCTGFLLSWVKLKKIDNKKRFLIFFWLLTCLLLLQQFGLVHFPFFEKLPVFKQTQFTKYSSSLIGFSMITTVAIFLDYLSKKKSKLIMTWGVLTTGLILYVNYFYQDAILANLYLKKYFGFISANVFYALGIVLTITLLFTFVKNQKLKLFILFTLILVEFYIYFPKDGDQTRRDSLRQPPAITYLLEKNYKEFKIFGLNNILFPNLATIYDLNDVRMLDALWIDRYYQYMKAFFAEPDAFRITGIRENGATQSANITKNNFFDMLSVKYLLSYNSIEEEVNDNKIIEAILKQNSDTSLLGKSFFNINKEYKNILFQHAPGNITVKVIKSAGAKSLYLFPAMSQDLFGTQNGDGVIFTAKVYVNNRIIDSQSIDINPANIIDDEKWFEFKLGPLPRSTSSYELDLQLVTNPKDNNAYDWSGWGGFIWDNEQEKIINKYKLIYDDEMKIYENMDFVPRIHLVQNVICTDESDKDNQYSSLIELMKQHEDDIKNTAIIDGKKCDNRLFDPGKATITQTNFDDNELSFIYSSSQPQYAVLSDAFYPGWNIYIDGKKGSIDPVNLTFRGFNLPAGTEVKVEMKYESIVFRIGMIITVVSLGFCLIIIFQKQNEN